MHGDHKVKVITKHYNNTSIRGIIIKTGALCVGKMIISMTARTAKGKSSLILVWFKDVWPKLWLKMWLRTVPSKMWLAYYLKRKMEKGKLLCQDHYRLC